MECLDYFNGNELATSVWKSKYQLKKDGLPMERVPSEMHAREARELARIEQKYKNPIPFEKIFNRLNYFSEIIPQGSVMSMLGNPYQIGSLSNCIVLPELKDSYGGIMYADQQLVQLMKRRCGVGLEISPLRPSGMLVSNAAQSATGGVSFMPRFSNTTREVAQDGRRGALMISCDIRYPDIPSFVVVKNDLKSVTGANISIRMRDDFMEAVEAGETYQLRWPVDASVDQAEFVAECDAKELWHKIASSARNYAEPGIIFWDRQHWYSPSSVYLEFKNISTNPCSEIAMGNDSCRLFAGNWAASVRNPFTSNAEFDYDHHYKVTYDAIKLMDDLVDLELEAIDRILNKVKSDPEPEAIKQVEIDTWQRLAHSGERGRRTGYGFTALGDTLAMLGLKYDSNDALGTVDKIMKIKLEAELASTIDMAEQRGPFPAWDRDLEYRLSKDDRTFFHFIKTKYPRSWERMMQVGRRNISWSTVAPTGSLSLMALLGHTQKKSYFSVTSGIEPAFNTKPNTLWHIRRKKVNSGENARVDFTDELGDKWQEFKVFHEGFQMWAETNFPGLEIQAMGEDDLQVLVANSPYAGSGSSEISWHKRLEMQSIVQRYTTHSISSTINLPSSATTEEVSQIYFEAWKLGLKGITVYRDGSRSGVLVSEPKKTESKFAYHNAPKRPKELPCEVHVVTAKGVKWTVIVGLFDGNPYEVFAVPRTDSTLDKITTGKVVKKGKGQYDFVGDGVSISNFTQGMSDEEEVLTRLISTALRHGSAIDFIVEQLNKTHGSVVSFSKAISRILSKYAKALANKKYTCSDCGSENVKFEEGCHKCADCGSSKCG